MEGKGNLILIDDQTDEPYKHVADSVTEESKMKRRSTKTEQDVIQCNTEHDPETQNSLDKTGDTKSSMATTYNKTGNLVILDNHTNKPYEYTPSVSTDEQYSLEEDDTCTDLSVNEEDIRILLVGRTGHGKSSTGNSIIGTDKFKTAGFAESVTSTTQWSGAFHRFRKKVEVVDTPGFFDTDQTERKIHKELILSLLYATPGFHVIALVLEPGRFTKEIEKTKNLFFDWFGDGVEKYACIILTRTEKEELGREYISKNAPKGLQELIRKCGGESRVAYIENKPKDKELKEAQVKKILDMVEEIKKSNNNTHFTNIALKLATTYAYSYRSAGISSKSFYMLRNTAANVPYKDRLMLDRVLGCQDESDDSTYGSDTVEDKDVSHIESTETDRLYDFKSDVSSGRTDETGLFKYLRAFWRRYINKGNKEKNCIIV